METAKRNGPGESPQAWGRRLAGYCWRTPRMLSIAFGAAVVGAAAGVAIPLVMRTVVNDAAARVGARSLLPGVLVLVAAGLVSAGMSFVSRYGSARVACDAEFHLRTDMFESLERLDGLQQDRLRTGQVVSRSTIDVTTVVELLKAMPTTVASALQFLAILIVMVVLSPLLSAIVGVAMFAVFFAARYASRSFFPATWDVSQREAMVASTVEASIMGVRVVKGFGREHDELTKLERASAKLFASSMRAARLTVVYLPLFRYIPIFGQIGVLAVGGFLALHGHLTLGTFIAFSAYLATAMGPISEVATQITAVQSAQASAVRVFEVIDATPQVTDPVDATELPTGALSVDLDHVTFAYGTGSAALTDVSIHIKAGETVAIVGGAGSGKSTVALLIARFYDPWEGSVRIGGRDARSVTMSSLRSRMGVVLEDDFLIAGTIRDNIAFYRPGATADRVIEAARTAEIGGFVTALPDGYDRVVGEHGYSLSGGQRQRIALARAILGSPDLLVLDDATSAVDAGVEADIHATLERATRGRTTVLIAHRRSTLGLADRIVVMDVGRVVDIGTHDELRQRCARYRLLLAGVDTETGTARATAEAPSPSEAPEAGVTRDLWSRSAHGSGDPEDAVGLTPHQLARIAELPAAADTPGIDLAEAEQGESHFGVRQLWPAIRTGFLLSSGLVVVEASLGLVQPWLARHAIDQGVLRSSPLTLWTMCGAGLLAVAVIWIATNANLRIVTRNSSRVLYLLRIKVFAHLQRLGLDYYDREPAGQIMTRMNGDPEAIRAFVDGWAGELVVRSLTFLGVTGLMLAIDPRLALAALAPLPVFVVAVLFYRRLANDAYNKVREQYGHLNAFLQESLSGIRVTQVFGGGPATINRYANKAGSYRTASMVAQRQLSGFVALAELCQQAALIVVVALGASYLGAGTLTSGGLFAFLLYVGMLFAPVIVLSEVVDAYQLARVGIQRIHSLLSTPTTTPLSAKPIELDELRGDIQFDDVHFSYPSVDASSVRVEALAGVDLVVDAGQTVAVVGTTGAGKSTVIKLVARFYDPTSGTVRIDGHDLRELDLRGYRSRLGFVAQENYLFSGTVRDVIAYARPEAADHEVEDAARSVGAHDMIASFEHGYLHPVGEGGGNLSAGQRQLLALARAELPKPAILLLDEATASLDLATEAAVARATQRLSAARTTIVIAHRLTTAKTADHIVVVENGRIAEAGSHHQLLQRDGRYAALWAAHIA